MTAPEITQADLLAKLHYDPSTGVFTWKHRSDVPRMWNTRYAGKTAGFAWKLSEHCSYWSIRIHDWPFLGHRLAWLYVTGAWPELVDHRDGDGLNNRWDNLREATRSQNATNSRLISTNTTGYRGVSRIGKRYRASIVFAGRQRWLGSFADPRDAHAAYLRAAHDLHGEFVRMP